MKRTAPAAAGSAARGRNRDVHGQRLQDGEGLLNQHANFGGHLFRAVCNCAGERR
jgi:hypothetical protein